MFAFCKLLNQFIGIMGRMGVEQTDSEFAIELVELPQQCRKILFILRMIAAECGDILRIRLKDGTLIAEVTDKEE